MVKILTPEEIQAFIDEYEGKKRKKKSRRVGNDYCHRADWWRGKWGTADYKLWPSEMLKVRERTVRRLGAPGRPIKSLWYERDVVLLAAIDDSLQRGPSPDGCYVLPRLAVRKKKGQ